MTKTLLAIGFAELSDGPTWNIEGIVTEASTENLIAQVAPRKRGRPKGSYKRRDMQAGS